MGNADDGRGSGFGHPPSQSSDLEGSGLTETERQIVRKLLSHGLFLDASYSSESSLCFMSRHSSGALRIEFYIPRQSNFTPPTGELSADWLNIVEKTIYEEFGIELLPLDAWA
jgi:hypothetical protein